MSSKQLILGVFLTLCVGSAWAQDEPGDDDEDTKELSGYSVGSDMRTGFESDAEIKLEKPDFSRDLKMESPRPSMSGMNVESSRPKLKVISAPPKPATSSSRSSGERQGSNAASDSSRDPSAGSAGRSASGGSGQASSQPSNQASGQTTEIRPLKMNPPEYPQRALRQRQEGSVTLEFTVTENGSTDDITIVSANPPRIFNREAIRAVADWKFEPARVNGVPQPQRIRHTIEFTLQ